MRERLSLVKDLYSVDTEYVIGKAEPSALSSATNGVKKMSKKNLTS